MKNLVAVFLLSLSLFVIGCANKVSTSVQKVYPVTSPEQKIDSWGVKDIVWKDYEVIGSVEAGGVSCFNYDDMLKSFEIEVRKIGGDALKFLELSVPDYVHSACYYGKAQIIKYYEENASQDESNAELAVSSSSSAKQVFVAVLETVSDGVTGSKENIYLTNVLREEAVKALPSDKNYTIMTRENISQMLPPDISIEDCEGSCLVETGRNIAADFVTQARVSSFGNSITISIELYETSTSKLIRSLNAKSPDIESPEMEIRKNSPSLFGEIDRLSGNR